MTADQFCFVAVTFGMTSAQMYFYTTILKNLFAGAKDVVDQQTFWNVSDNCTSS